ncbi:ribonuclease HI [Anabaena cylindrica FACHB-243]|uniref:Ribonuclease H n=1 Tax=Anabaena cylindrica (strain ATCC 27899 / PCC 7122) TaxID=272123 RepID=K9ZIL3_ANACC|nr:MULTISPECIES: ribonuclease HI [Anabaena]AFZ59041.1 Ribonuclease H [Anabaena cylindrica PCC 7122]MBD2420620.1 ribonuclease HI [Anabaena cylindrica FACHB-243]MBY5285516.1 ribonuclease HI [Anabaena sp. CCAP 1446/1C]MBY5309393.1 ribonuclease HI [Anabaena sp. CCAP 1446/1C]MCM2408579.1 ribonuclease HI [Anabaena sp. CCAP 1446/1C]
MSTQPIIQSIYTDGACTGNPGPGGWGVVVYFQDGSIHEMGDASSHTTNNKMEMQAAIAALEFLETSGQTQPITLYTDSEYLINSVTKWMPGWKKKGWKKSDGNPVQNQDLLETLDQLNSRLVKWQHVRGHSGNIGNERCDVIARSFASGKIPSLQQLSSGNVYQTLPNTKELNVIKGSDSAINSTKINKNILESSTFPSDTTTMEPSTASAATTTDEKPSEMRVLQLRNLVETLRIADEISEKGYLITSSELADLMDVHASAVTSRGDQWRWRNWIVSRVRREGNQILWELERGDQLESEAD